VLESLLSNSFSRSFIVYFTSSNALLVRRPPLRYSKVLVIILFIFVLLAKMKANCFGIFVLLAKMKANR
jgi:hypothetical protein